ncbi:MAG TPA: hypothetical protein V6D00_09390 [Pantanalinema sp.]
MKRASLPLILAFALPVAPAFAAPPSAFKAEGTAVSFAGANAPEQRTPVTLYYQDGKMRLELVQPSMGESILLAKRGSTQITLLDTAQKMAFVMTADAIGGQAGVPSVEQFLDMAAWKTQLKGARRLSGTEVKGAQRCTGYQKTIGGTDYTVWLSDALELPMQIEGSVAGKPRFRIAISRVTKGQQPAGLFGVPAGYQKAELDAGMLNQR